LTTIHSKKPSIASVPVDQPESQPKQEELKQLTEPQIENIIQYEEQPEFHDECEDQHHIDHEDLIEEHLQQ
jgi:hypothetical protein